jgi:hypothetical protein
MVDSKGQYEDKVKLSGLRAAQLIRTKAKGHSAKRDAERLALEALSEHETYAAHFRHVCEKIHDELEMIQNHLNDIEAG